MGKVNVAVDLDALGDVEKSLATELKAAQARIFNLERKAAVDADLIRRAKEFSKKIEDLRDYLEEKFELGRDWD